MAVRRTTDLVIPEKPVDLHHKRDLRHHKCNYDFRPRRIIRSVKSSLAKVQRLFDEAKRLYTEAVEICRASQRGDISSSDAMRRVEANTHRASMLVEEAFRIMSADMGDEG